MVNRMRPGGCRIYRNTRMDAMKIYPDPTVLQNHSIQKKQPPAPAAKTKAPAGTDKVDFSAELQKIQDVRKDDPVDTDRQAKLEDVRQQIKAGTYRPDSVKVAESLLKYIVEGG